MAEQFTDIYEQWKAEGRPGGSFEAWKTGRGGAPTPSPALSPSPSTPPAPAPPALTPGTGGLLGGGAGRGGLLSYPPAPGGPTPAPRLDRQGQNVPVGPDTPDVPTGGPAAPQAGGGDPYIDEVRGSGSGKSEDYDRFSDAELKAWEKYYIGNGKYRNIYGDIVDKPDERGPNTPHNRNGTGDQGDFGWGWNDSSVGGDPPGGGGGGGKGRGKGGGGGEDIGALGGKADTLWNEIMNLQSRYSPEVMQKLMAGAKRQGASAGARAREGASLDAVRRGVGRSTLNIGEDAAREAEAGVVNPASTFYTGEKIKADQEDRITKLNAMQNWINSARQHIQAMTATANQKEIAYAQLDLAQKRLAQELEMQQREMDYGMARDAYGRLGY